MRPGGREYTTYKGSLRMSSKSNKKITDAQISDVRFVEQLCEALARGGVDSAKYLHDGRHLSLMVDNYQIDIAQTDVFYYSNFLNKFFGIGEWGFKPGDLERYSLSVMENYYPMRWQQNPEMAAQYKLDPNGSWRTRYNVAFMKAAMATEKGIYKGPRICSTCPDAMFYHQNQHLFEPLKKLWLATTAKYPESRVFGYSDATHETRYDIPNIHGDKDLQDLRNRVLNAIRHEKSK